MKPLLWVLCAGIIWSGTSGNASVCSIATKLTDDEARILLYLTPEAFAARQAKTDVDIEASAPSSQFPKTEYFVGAIISQRPLNGSVLGNGILGYFAVNKSNGTVENISDMTDVSGKELRRVQSLLRHLHCIRD